MFQFLFVTLISVYVSVFFAFFHLFSRLFVRYACISVVIFDYRLVIGRRVLRFFFDYSLCIESIIKTESVCMPFWFSHGCATVVCVHRYESSAHVSSLEFRSMKALRFSKVTTSTLALAKIHWNLFCHGYKSEINKTTKANSDYFFSVLLEFQRFFLIGPKFYSRIQISFKKKSFLLELNLQLVPNLEWGKR